MAEIFWTSATHHGSIKHFIFTAANGNIPLDESGVCDLGFWSSAAERKSGRAEHTLPFGHSLDATLARLSEKYAGFHVIDEPDAVAEVLRNE